METIIKSKTKRKVKVSREEQGQVIVHCTYHTLEESLIRIWKSTYLICLQTGKKRKMIHAENISVYPVWTRIDGNVKYTFTLFFPALPKLCSSFKLLEDIPESGGFRVDLIQRNKTDVYHVKI